MTDTARQLDSLARPYITRMINDNGMCERFEASGGCAHVIFMVRTRAWLRCTYTPKRKLFCHANNRERTSCHKHNIYQFDRIADLNSFTWNCEQNSLSNCTNQMYCRSKATTMATVTLAKQQQIVVAKRNLFTVFLVCVCLCVFVCLLWSSVRLCVPFNAFEYSIASAETDIVYLNLYATLNIILRTQRFLTVDYFIRICLYQNCRPTCSI